MKKILKTFTNINFDEHLEYYDEAVVDINAIDTDAIYKAKLLLRENSAFTYIAINFNGHVELKNENTAAKVMYSRVLVFDSAVYMLMVDKNGGEYEVEISEDLEELGV